MTAGYKGTAEWHMNRNRLSNQAFRWNTEQRQPSCRKCELHQKRRGPTQICVHCRTKHCPPEKSNFPELLGQGLVTSSADMSSATSATVASTATPHVFSNMSKKKVSRLHPKTNSCTSQSNTESALCCTSREHVCHAVR